jgi:hypothetical protein
VIEALFMSKLLDPYFKSLLDKEDVILPSFSAAYLERRVLNEPSNGLPGLCRIRDIANRLAHESIDGRDVLAYTKQLCRLVVQKGYPRAVGIWEANKFVDEFDLEAHTFVAALGMQTMPVVDRYIASGKTMEAHTPWFGLTQQLVAEFGPQHLLAAAMTHQDKVMFNNIRLSMLTKVAEAGRADATRFVLGFECDGWPWEFSREKRPAYRRQNEWILADIRTPSKEVFDILTEKRRMFCINRQFGKEEYTCFLRNCALRGWAEMAACYLKLGASVDGLGPSSFGYKEQDRPLLDACSYGHQDIVKLLLDYDASTSAPALEYAAGKGHLGIVRMLLAHGAEHGDALSRAAAKGYGDVVEELLNHGAEVRDRSASLLVSAVEHEHTAMFRLLVERGCEVRDADTAAKCVEVAKEQGLESMLQLLKEFGVEHDGIA